MGPCRACSIPFPPQKLRRTADPGGNRGNRARKRKIGGPQGPVHSSRASPRAPQGPPRAGRQGDISANPCCSRLHYSLQGQNMSPKIAILVIWGHCWVNKKMSLRGWDLSGEIRAEIPHRTPLRMCKMVGWRPDWCQKGVIWGPLGFRAALAHPNQPTNQSFFFIIASHVWPSCVSPRDPFGQFFHHHRPCVAIMCHSSDSFLFILIRFSKQWFQLGEPPPYW